MRKLIVVVLIKFILFIFIACSTETSYEMSADNAMVHPISVANDSYKVVFDCDPHFRSFQTPDLVPWYVRYEIINKEGEIVKTITSDRAVLISYITENILEISVSTGLAIPSVMTVQFYSLKDDIFSDIFETQPFYIRDETIAYIDRSYEDCYVLIVQNIFNPEIFHRKFLFEEFSPLAHPSACTYVEYLGNNQIKVAPLFDADFNERYVILDLG
ncbi:MAG: hypothetical protein FWC92_07245 [Defluviitaleaceae bacterium]|nr:hypothetical protein [Defluviitaleaceae bacterium]